MKIVVPQWMRPMCETHHFSPAVIDGDHLRCSGMIGIRPDMTVAEDPRAQFTQAFENLRGLLAEASLTFADVTDQATQASDKSGEGSKGDDASHGAPGKDALGPESSAEKPEDKDKKDDQKSEDDKKDESRTGAHAGPGPQAPVGAPQAEPSQPGQAPRHGRMTETPPEVAL
ncbi:hypothetical protein H7H51_24505 [Mycolicibacterium farcinogenes]|nr:hypothetical protein [Mycolicibacterium farcinogenes]